ncbi:hypothetical protein UA08_01617 [Talaromyces atroroseus]|uniref:Norsolorinic acid ketoreductase n=1 Tax=Talaromyces atroroseus TaxID=1441469 RepID=A0A1Q5QBS6_TALAT|nr:hypothetical protein UA08_01617 [Talaromyces atroroseus]OKL63219.1 hypothetical protein UA08_01617 [Talaromyces atroroseus]
MEARQISFDDPSKLESLVAPDEVVYLITGANRGIGWTLLKYLVLRPNIVVIACVRRLTTQFTDNLENITSHPTSRVLISELPDLNGSEPSSDQKWDNIRTSLEAGIHGFHIDVLIANAGTNTPYVSAKDATPADFRLGFGVNVIGPLNLFRTFRTLLLAAKEPKFIAISSLGGSIETGPDLGPMTSYGSSKAALNYLTRKIHVDEERITTLAMDPGFVQTDMGGIFAAVLGIEKPPVTAVESATGILKRIDELDKTTSGRFLDIEGKVNPW